MGKRISQKNMVLEICVKKTVIVFHDDRFKCFRSFDFAQNDTFILWIPFRVTLGRERRFAYGCPWRGDLNCLRRNFF